MRPQHPLQPPSSSRRETRVPAWSRQKIETLWFVKGDTQGAGSGEICLPVEGGCLPSIAAGWRCLFAADGARVGEMADWGHAAKGSRFGSKPWQLVIRQAFKHPLPDVSKAGVKLP